MNTLAVVQLLTDGVNDKLLLAKVMVELFKPDVVPKVRAVSLLNLLGTESKNARDIAFAIAAGFVCNGHLTTAFARELFQRADTPLTHACERNTHFGVGRFLGALKGLALLHEHSLELLLSGEEGMEIENTLLPALDGFLFGMQGEFKLSGGTEGLLSEVVTELVEKNPTFVRIFLTRMWKKRVTKAWSPLAVQVVNEFAYKAFGKLLSVSERARAVSDFIETRAIA